jgi:butyrate kinase
MMHRILVINCGSTSTKIAIFEDQNRVFDEEINHDMAYLSNFKKVIDQLEYRKKDVIESLKTSGFSIEEMDAISCRGGLIGPIESGTYAVDESMINALRNSKVDHASNLSGLIGYELSKGKIPIYTTDPVSVDEMDDIARISGIPDLERKSYSHALNMKMVGRMAAQEIGKKYEECNFVIAHLGGGISVAAHKHGRMVDVNNANDEGPFSPERTGEMPVGDIVKIAYSGKYTKDELKRRYVGHGGLISYLSTNDLRIALNLAKADKQARVIVEAMAYQIAKGISEMATVLDGKVDAIVLTGGMSYSNEFIGIIRSYISKISLVLVIAGGHEMEALAMGTLRVLEGKEKAKFYDQRSVKVNEKAV